MQMSSKSKFMSNVMKCINKSISINIDKDYIANQLNYQ